MNDNQEKRHLRDEVAELSQAVRDLREQLAQRDQHHCHGHYCCHHYYTPVPWYPNTITPYIVTCGTSTASGAAIGGSTITYTNALAS